MEGGSLPPVAVGRFTIEMTLSAVGERGPKGELKRIDGSEARADSIALRSDKDDDPVTSDSWNNKL